MTLQAFNEADFESSVLAADRPVLVEFSAPWCSSCHAIRPVLEQLASELEHRVTIGTIDVDRYPAVADRYGIRGLPTMLLFRNGEVAGQAVGFLPKKALADVLEIALEQTI